MDDAAAMARALALGERGRRTSAPNPWVGCLLIRGGDVVGEGFHRAAGEPHAEAQALVAAGEQARGASAYVTLEPCCHHGRTPPCADALIAAGVERVVVGVLDPDPRVAGQGVARLRSAGLVVEVGVGAEELREGGAAGVEHPLVRPHERLVQIEQDGTHRHRRPRIQATRRGGSPARPGSTYAAAAFPLDRGSGRVVADDDASIRAVAAEVLEEEPDLRAAQACDGTEALAMLARDRPALLLPYKER